MARQDIRRVEKPLAPNREIRKAMREGNAQVSGSKLSFANPLTAIIKKKQ